MIRVIIFLFILLGNILYTSNAFCETIARVLIRVEIDPTKNGGSSWDTINPFGRAPDPIGFISVGYQKYNVEERNSFTVDTVFRNVNMNVGDPIEIELFDRDRGRWDDEICKGVIRWNGEPQMEVRHGFANVKLEFQI